jgi:hypothetical protein
MGGAEFAKLELMDKITIPVVTVDDRLSAL